jgi:hypothetical protein
MLKNTLILPTEDGKLAAKLMKEAIADLDVLLMLVFGQGPKVNQVIEWADQLCNKTGTGAGNLRRVVWIQDGADDVMKVLAPVVGAKPPMVAALDFHDQLKVSLSANDPIDPFVLENAFLKAGLL